ncbi:MAG: thioesterase family protein [Salinivirgaceae bacterium]|jgi:acyl-CoA thioester hydrolase|nr:thioesterase family protein [Salinivirgaceae bacterium]
MYQHETNIRVRYSETDKMGVVYHSHYIEYYEVARTECMRSLGMSYRELEATGIILPVTKVESIYKGSLYYDDEVVIVAKIKELPSYKIRFEYDVKRDDVVVNKGVTELVFYDANRKKPCRAPQEMIEKLKPHFESKKVIKLG